MKIAGTFVAAILILGGCGKKDNSNSAETGTVKATEEKTEEDAATDETTTAALPTLDVNGAIALAIATSSGGANLTSTESNLRKINADGTDGSALSDSNMVTQAVVMGPKDDIYVLYVDPNQIAGSDTPISADEAHPPGAGLTGEGSAKPYLAKVDKAGGQLSLVNPEIKLIDIRLTGIKFDENGDVYYGAQLNQDKDSLGLHLSRTTTAGVSTVLSDRIGGEFAVVNSHLVVGTEDRGKALLKLNTDTKEVETISPDGKLILAGADGKMYFTEGGVLKSYDLATGTIAVIDFSVLCPSDNLGCTNYITGMTNYGSKVLATWGNQHLVDITQPVVTEFIPFDLAVKDLAVGVVISDTKIVITKHEMVASLNLADGVTPPEALVPQHDVIKLFLRDDVAGTTVELLLTQEIEDTQRMVYLAATNEILFTGHLVGGKDYLGRYNLTTGVSTFTAISGYSDIQSLSK
jgi:hypothetical protein